MGDLVSYQYIFFNLFIPGLIIYRFLQLKLAFRPLNVSNSILEILALGTGNYCLYAFVTYILNLEGNLYLQLFFALITPLILAFFFYKISQLDFFKKKIISFSPDAWDEMWSKEDDCFVAIETENDKIVGGYFGKDSYVTRFPNEKGIYIEEEWYINDDYEFVQAIPSTNGVYVNFNKIISIKKYG